jgi:hypothetical protein
VPLAYRRQLALYRALLASLYPGRTVRAFLLWTAVPLLMEIDAKTLDSSMPYARYLDSAGTASYLPEPGRRRSIDRPS